MRPALLMFLLTVGCGSYDADTNPLTDEDAASGGAPIDGHGDGSGGDEATGGTESEATGGDASAGGSEATGGENGEGAGGDEPGTGGADGWGTGGALSTGGDVVSGAGGDSGDGETNEECNPLSSRRCTNGVGAGACFGRQSCREDGSGWETYQRVDVYGEPPTEYALCIHEAGHTCPSVDLHGCGVGVDKCSDGLCATDHPSGECP